MSQMEAVEMLVASGYQPEHTVYLAFGADEEVGGHRGAEKIAALLKEQGAPGFCDRRRPAHHRRHHARPAKARPR